MGKWRALVPVLFVVLAGSPLAADVWDLDQIGEDDSTATDTELGHGLVQVHDLAAVGGIVDEDWYRVANLPFSSYEVLIEDVTGDLYTTGLPVDRIASDGVTVIGSSVPLPGGLGASRTLRWVNATANGTTEWVRVSGANTLCTTACTTDDRYTIRFFETTASIPRFNNSATQVTILLLQNVSTQPVSGTIFFWSAAGALVTSQPFAVNPKALLVSNTASQTGSVSGSTTIVHDGRYGDLQGKSVALEPATGFSFDTPLAYRPH